MDAKNRHKLTPAETWFLFFSTVAAVFMVLVGAFAVIDTIIEESEMRNFAEEREVWDRHRKLRHDMEVLQEDAMQALLENNYDEARRLAHEWACAMNELEDR